MGGWWLQQQKAKMNELLLRNSYTRRTSLSSRIPLSPAKPELESSPVQAVLPSKPRPPRTAQSSPALKPAATIRKVWPEFNVEHRDQHGMHIHVALSVANLLGRTGTVAAYFYFANGVPLKDFNDNHGTQTGNVCVARSFTPTYLNALYNDFVLFMPYLELHMGPGNHSLKFFSAVWDDQHKELAWTDWVLFTYTSAT